MEARKIIKTEAKASLKSNFANAVIIVVIAAAIGVIARLVGNILAEWLDFGRYGLSSDAVYAELETKYIAGEISLQEYLDMMTESSKYSWVTTLFTAVGLLGGIFIVPRAGFFLKNLDGGKPTVKDFFGGGKRLLESLWLHVLMVIKIALWTLLFIVPGIIKFFSYSMAPYLKHNNPEKSANDCIKESCRLMNGYKGSLFVLYLSFIGWLILAEFVVLMVGYIPGIAGQIVSAIVSLAVMSIVYAYMYQCEAIFYRELTNPYLNAKYNGGPAFGAPAAPAASAGNTASGNADPFEPEKPVDPFEPEKPVDPFEERHDDFVDPFAAEENTQSANTDDNDPFNI